MTAFSTPPSNLNSFQNESLHLLTDVFDVDRAAAYLVDNNSNPVCFKVHQVQPGMHRDYMERFYQYDPLHPVNQQERDIPVMRTNETVSIGERPDHPYYAEFMRPWGIQDMVELYLRSNGRIVAGFTLFISQHNKELLLNDMKKMQGLHRYLQFALEQCLDSPEQATLDSFSDKYNLTAKERMVVEQILNGQPNKSIARNLCCSVPTVKTHLQHIFGKVSVNSKAEIASLLYQYKTRH